MKVFMPRHWTLLKPRMVAAERFAVLWKKNTDPHVPKGGNVLEFGTRYARLEAVPWDVAVRSSGQSLTDKQAECVSVLEPDDWKVSTWVNNPRPLLYDRQTSHGGGWSARLSASSEDDVLLQQSVRVDPTATYLFSGWVKTRDVHICKRTARWVRTCRYSAWNEQPVRGRLVPLDVCERGIRSGRPIGSGCLCPSGEHRQRVRGNSLV